VGIRGKYFEEYRKGTNLVLLSPDVAKVFSTEEAVNEALRSLINLAENQQAEQGAETYMQQKKRCLPVSFLLTGRCFESEK
jgi:hypothetical protein